MGIMVNAEPFTELQLRRARRYFMLLHKILSQRCDMRKPKTIEELQEENELLEGFSSFYLMPDMELGLERVPKERWATKEELLEENRQNIERQKNAFGAI